MKKIFSYGEEELKYLSKKDKKLKKFIEEVGFIERKINSDVFAALIESIIGQQISNKAYATVSERFYDLCGKITPKNVYALDDAEIQKCGMSLRKVGYIKNAAECGVNKTIDFKKLKNLTDEEIIKKLIEIKGVGQWTAEMLLIFSLERKDVLSFGDLQIKNGLKKLHDIDKLDKKTFEHYKNLYSPYGSIAAFYLWHISQT